MKMAFIVHNEFFTPKVMELLEEAGIDYYTRWEHVQGKGHGTEPNVGTGGFASTNVLMMIGFPEDAPLAKLSKAIAAANEEITRPSDKIRLFQLPLERIV